MASKVWYLYIQMNYDFFSKIMENINLMPGWKININLYGYDKNGNEKFRIRMHLIFQIIVYIMFEWQLYTLLLGFSRSNHAELGFLFEIFINYCQQFDWNFKHTKFQDDIMHFDGQMQVKIWNFITHYEWIGSAVSSR